MQRTAKPESSQRLTHRREQHLGLVAEREQRFGAVQLLALARDVQHFVRRHGMRTGLAWIAAKSAVSAVVAAQVGQGDENLARVGDHTGPELFFYRARGRQ